MADPLSLDLSPADEAVAAEALALQLEELLELARANPKLAEVLRGMAKAVLELLPHENPVRRAAPDAPPLDAPTDAPQHLLASSEDLERLVSGFPVRSPLPESLSETDDLPEFDPEQLAANLLLKAEACRWLQHHGYTSEGPALAERYRLIEAGRAQGCYLWMLDPRVVNPLSSSAHELLSHAYRAAAEALELWRACEGQPEEAQAAPLLAEAQSALRVAVNRSRGLPGNALEFVDDDQRSIFEELRAFGRLTQTYLDHLSLSRPADPAACATIRERVLALGERRKQRAMTLKKQRDDLRRLAYHAEKLEHGSHNPEHDLAKVIGAIHDLAAGGLQESAPAFDAPLRPILAILKGSPDPVTARVTSYIEQRDRVGQEAHEEPEPLLPEVAQLARLLRGRTIVMIGGEPRPEALRKIERSFSCRLEWLSGAPHQSHYDFEPAIARREVALVLLLIRWSSHGFAEVSDFCRAHGKPLVRVPSGYGVNSLAHAVLNQASGQLIR